MRISTYNFYHRLITNNLENGKVYGCGKADSYQIQPLRAQVKKSSTKSPEVSDKI